MGSKGEGVPDSSPISSISSSYSPSTIRSSFSSTSSVFRSGGICPDRHEPESRCIQVVRVGFDCSVHVAWIC